MYFKVIDKILRVWYHYNAVYKEKMNILRFCNLQYRISELL